MKLYQPVRSAWPVTCDGCRRSIKTTRGLVINGTEFSMCFRCLKELVRLVAA